MTNWLSKSLVCVFSAAAALELTARSQAAAVYLDPASTALFSQSYNLDQNTAGGNGLKGLGDDYSTGYSSILLTGLSFNGGDSGSDATESVDINFYTTAGVLAATVAPSASEIVGSYSTHTLASSDFGSGITIPGSGYYIFAPYDATNASTYMFLESGTSPATTGSTDGNYYQASDTGAISSAGTFHPYVNIELDGTGTSVPEPASLGLIASGSLLLVRRRRTA